MKDNTALLKMLFDCVTDPLLLLDAKFSPLMTNAAFLRLAGDAMGRTVEEKEIAGLLPTLKGLSPSDATLRELQLKGSEKGLKFKIYALPDKLTLLRAVNNFAAEDLRRNLHAQRMETLGMLAGGIAHDFNNILTGLLGHVSYLKNVLPQTGSHTISVKAIEDGAKRASSLTSEILKFARLGNDERAQRIDLADLIERTYHLLRGAISPQYEMNFSTPDERVVVLANEAKIAQVLINLVVNARDALGRGGVINISLDIVDDPEELSAVLSRRDLSIGRYARIEVKDNGHGMSPQLLKQIFEPYFTTKKDKGTGLGLAIVNEIVNLFSGTIHVRSVEGEGTSVSVYIPVFDDPVAEPAQSKTPDEKELERGVERILVVDDEYPVRNVICMSLEHLGYSVTMAASGEEALEIYQRSEQPFDLVIMDMLMPNMTGDQTFFLLKEIDPDVRVMLISGYSSPEAVQNVLEKGGLGFIQKPFTISDLAERVRKCFD